MPLQALVNRGYAIASIDYRLTTTAPFPANIHDIKAAIRFLRANAKAYHIDEKRIVIAGASAGGHLAALAGLTGGTAELDGELGEYLGTSSEVQAIVSLYGASNLTTILSQSSAHGLSVRVPALQLLLGGSPEEKPALAELASPVFQLDAKDPPLLLFHGDQDNQMPIEQARELKRACDATGLRCEFHVLEGAGHGGDVFYRSERIDQIDRFLKSVMVMEK
jgi:acetyl esterase/lipase